MNRRTFTDRTVLGAAALTLAALTLTSSPPVLANTPSATIKLPDPPKEAPGKGNQAAVLAGGCFWGLEGLFEHVKGVKSVTSGYAGGTQDTANYPDVSSEKTKHAEAVRIVYDPAKVSYGTLLKIFFSVAHDPTELNRQTPDVGTSYRSAIFPQNPVQRAMAESYIAAINKANSFGKPIVTTVETGNFFPAEAYHQDFMRRHPDHGYIVAWDKPKLTAFKSRYPNLYMP